ncbi:hypothetical protein GGX14DRAFT_430425, partial [Mycena pura]
MSRTLPVFIGTILNWLLFGVLLVQVYIYFIAFPKDRTWWKAGVVAILVLELIETLSNARDMVRTFGSGWGDMEVLDDVGWAWFSVPVMGSVVAFVGQMFFAYRIYKIARSKYVPVLVLILSVVQLGAGIWTGVNICIARKFSLLQSHNVVATAFWLAGTSLCDLVIVFSTVYYINKALEPGFRRVRPDISRIIMLTVETGALCALFAIVDLYLFVSHKGTNYHLALCIELSKIYSNSILLVQLNSPRAPKAVVLWKSGRRKRPGC